MNHTVKRATFTLLVIASSLLMKNPVFAQTDSLTNATIIPTTDLVTGRSYWGFDLGLTGSAYIGSNNFLWGIKIIGMY